MTTADPDPQRVTAIEQRLLAVEKALLGLANRVEALESHRAHGEQESDIQDLLRRLEQVEARLNVMDRALGTVIDGILEEKRMQRSGKASDRENTPEPPET